MYKENTRDALILIPLFYPLPRPLPFLKSVKNNLKMHYVAFRALSFRSNHQAITQIKEDIL